MTVTASATAIVEAFHEAFPVVESDVLVTATR